MLEIMAALKQIDCAKLVLYTPRMISTPVRWVCFPVNGKKMILNWHNDSKEVTQVLFEETMHLSDFAIKN